MKKIMTRRGRGRIHAAGAIASSLPLTRQETEVDRIHGSRGENMSDTGWSWAGYQVFPRCEP